MRRVFIVTLAVQTVLFAVRPMVSYRAIDLGADAFALGVIAASFSALSLLIAIPVGRRIDLHGETVAVCAGAALVAAVAASLVFVDSIVLLIVTQAVFGCGHILNVVGLQAWVANHSDDGRSDRNFGLFTVAVSLGQLLGPAGAGVLSTIGADRERAISAVFAACAVLGLIGTAVAAGLPSTSGGSRRAAADAGRLTAVPVSAILRRPGMPQAIVVGVTVMTSVDILTIYLPAYGEQQGLTVLHVGLLLAVRAAASLASRLLMGRLIETAGRKRVLIWSTLGPGLLIGGFPLMDHPAPMFAAMVVIGFGLGLGQPITLAWAAGQVPVHARGATLGLRLSINRLAQVTIPVGIGAAAGAFGIVAVFAATALMLTLSAGAARSTPFDST